MTLTDEQLEKYADITGGSSYGGSFTYSEEQYKEDCLARRETTCTNFVYDSKGFSAQIDLSGKGDQLVFFSVPYEDGWSAAVNGEPADIEKVNVGFMAIRVPGGQVSEIRFNYETPGLKIGMAITGACFLAFAVYMLFFRGKRPDETKKKQTYRIMRKIKAKKVTAALAGGQALQPEEELSPQARELLVEIEQEEKQGNPGKE